MAKAPAKKRGRPAKAAPKKTVATKAPAKKRGRPAKAAPKKAPVKNVAPQAAPQVEDKQDTNNTNLVLILVAVAAVILIAYKLAS